MNGRRMKEKKSVTTYILVCTRAPTTLDLRQGELKIRQGESIQ